MNPVSMVPDIKVEIIEIGHKMIQAGLPKEFIADAVSTAFEFEGVYDLLKMWGLEDDAKEKDEIISDIQELIDDCGQPEKIEDVYVRFDDLDGIVKNVRAFKDNLWAVVDKNGGLKHLSEVTGIPQPSLSRFFNSATRPRRTTLYKIAKALKLNQVQIATEWSK
jgi:hypothetical protein